MLGIAAERGKQCFTAYDDILGRKRKTQLVIFSISNRSGNPAAFETTRTRLPPACNAALRSSAPSMAVSPTLRHRMHQEGTYLRNRQCRTGRARTHTPRLASHRAGGGALLHGPQRSVRVSDDCSAYLGRDPFRDDNHRKDQQDLRPCQFVA